MNPILPKDFEVNSDFLLNPEYLITTTHNTHNAIHYGDENLLVKAPIERSKNDTCPWKITSHKLHPLL
jgi:V8-like Glu-specific endopeptidase